MEAPFKAHYVNISAPELCERAIAAGEGKLSIDGALVVETGLHTGRSAKDKFIVREAGTEASIWWESNGAIAREAFDLLRADMSRHAEGLELYQQDLCGCADAAHRVNVRVITQMAWHALFIRNPLIELPEDARQQFSPDLTIVDLLSFKADPARYDIRSETVIAIDLENRLILIGGASYAGEMKKAVFTYLNYVLPAAEVMPMHCAANLGADGRSALFFGLSGTGKTTLSADPARSLVGDDEHGWSASGIFNFEGGCYAKTIRLSQTSEPEIYAAVGRFGTIFENVAIDADTRVRCSGQGRHLHAPVPKPRTGPRHHGRSRSRFPRSRRRGALADRRTSCRQSDRRGLRALPAHRDAGADRAEPAVLPCKGADLPA